MMRVGLCVAGVWLFAAGTVSGQTPQNPDVPNSPSVASPSTSAPSAPTLAELLERIDALQQRVVALEQQLAVATSERSDETSTSPTAAHSHPPAAVSPLPMQLPATEEIHYPSLRLHGFADVNFVETDEPGPAGFHMGQVVLHLASALGPKVNVFAETSFAPRTPGSPVPTSYTTDIERAIIRYDHNDAFKLSFGRYHTPIGYWNNAYHHGLFLQTTISRPEMIQFGTAFQPVHFVGVLAEGRLPGSSLGLGYSAGLGNGRASLITRAGDAGDSNNHKALLATVTSRPAAINALEVGVSVYRDRFVPESNNRVDEWITGAHLAWTQETPEVIAEFTNVRHTTGATGQTFNSPAYYLQTAYRLPWQGARWKPYFRFEDINTPSAERLFEPLDVTMSTVGVRYDVADFAAFKGEYRRTRRRAQDARVNGFFLQTSFTF